MPSGLAIGGVVLADHIKNVDWRSRRATFIARAPANLLEEVIGKMLAMLEIES